MCMDILKAQKIIKASLKGYTADQQCQLGSHTVVSSCDKQTLDNVFSAFSIF